MGLSDERVEKCSSIAAPRAPDGPTAGLRAEVLPEDRVEHLPRQVEGKRPFESRDPSEVVSLWRGSSICSRAVLAPLTQAARGGLLWWTSMILPEM